MARRGQAMVELAVAFGVIFMLFSFIVDIQDQIHRNMVILSATSEGARWASRMVRPDSDGKFTLTQGVQRTCLYLQQAGYLPEDESCETDLFENETDRVSYTYEDPNGKMQVSIASGYYPRDYAPLASRNLMSGTRDYYERYYHVPVYVMVRYTNEYIVGFMSSFMGSPNTYTISQQSTYVTEGY